LLFFVSGADVHKKFCRAQNKKKLQTNKQSNRSHELLR